MTTSCPPIPPLSVAQRRRHERLDIRMSAEIRTDRTTFTAITRDISAGGVGLESDRPWEDGSVVTLGLFLVIDDVEEERTPPLWVKARVVWSADLEDGRFVAGLRFEVISKEQRAWLGQVVAHLAKSAPV